MYIGGLKRYENYMSTVELKIINSHRTCDIQLLDQGLAFHASVVTPIGVITCGGRTSNGRERKVSKKCFLLTNQNTWIPFPSLKKAPYNLHLVVLGDILVAIDPFYDRYEKIDWRNGDKWELIKMAIKLYKPCITKWDDENILITGGRNNRVSNAA